MKLNLSANGMLLRGETRSLNILSVTKDFLRIYETNQFPVDGENARDDIVRVNEGDEMAWSLYRGVAAHSNVLSCFAHSAGIAVNDRAVE